MSEANACVYGAERCEKGSGVPSILGLFEDRDEDRDEDGGGESRKMPKARGGRRAEVWRCLADELKTRQPYDVTKTEDHRYLSAHS